MKLKMSDSEAPDIALSSGFLQMAVSEKGNGGSGLEFRRQSKELFEEAERRIS